MPIFETALYAGVLPGLIAVAALVLAWRFAPSAHAGAIGAAGLTVAFLFGFMMLIGVPPFPATEATQWIAWFGVFIGLGAIIISYTRATALIRYSFQTVVSVVVAVLILNPFNEYLWEEQHVWLWIAGVALLCIVLYYLLDQHITAANPKTGLFLLFAAAFLAVPTLMNAGSIKLLQIAIMLTALFGAAWFASLFAQPRHVNVLIAPFVPAVLVPLLIAGNRFASLPDLSVVFIIAAVVVPWLVIISGGIPRPVSVLVLQILLILLLSSLAFYQTVDFSASADSGYEGYEGYEGY